MSTERKNSTTIPKKVVLISHQTLSLITSSVQFYHERLLQNLDLVKEVEKKTGISSESIKTFKIGFCDNSASSLWPKEEAIIENLATSGYIQKDHEESFKGYIIIPIFSTNHSITGIAGISFSNKVPAFKYLSLTNDQGFLNYQALINHQSIIFTSNLTDFFKAFQSRIKNVIPFLTKNISESQIRFFKENKTKEIFILFPYSKNKEKFQEICKLNLPIYSIESIESIHKTKPVFTPDEKIQTIPSFQVCQILNGYEFIFDKRKYRILGVSENNITSLKAVVRFDFETDSHFDSINLYSHKNRIGFIRQINEQFGIDTETIESDLKQLIQHIETEREKSFLNPKKNYQLSPEEKEIGLKFLKDKNLIQRIVSDMTTLGYMAENTNKIIGYLTATSRKMESPLACIVISRSAAGKSKLIDTIEKMIPEEDVISMSAATDQAFFYMTDGMLSHKLVTIAEQAGKTTADYPIRELLSKKSLTKAIPVKDNQGNTKTIFIKAEGPVSYMETTTNFNINPENASRCFTLYVDESPEQTKKIQQSQNLSRTLHGITSPSAVKEIITRHHSAQRLLEPIRVIIPFASSMKFPAHKLRTRRDNEKFLNLISVISFLFQYQREKKKTKFHDQEVVYIESTKEDYTMAYNLVMSGVLQTTLDELPKGSKDLLEAIKDMTKTGFGEVFTRRQLMEYTNWNFTQVRNYIKNLIDYEYLEVVKGNKIGQQHGYRLISDSVSDNKGQTYSNLILSPEELKIAT